MMGRWKINKKNIYGLICICIMVLLLPLNVAAAPEEDTELRIQYPYAGVAFEFYKVAAFSEKDGFELEAPFTKYENTIEGLSRLNELDSEEWRVLAFTLEQLVGTENMEPVKQITTDHNGQLVWQDIPKGLYLVLGEEVELGNKIYTPSPILITVPNYDENGDWNYQVNVIHNKIVEEEKEHFIDIPIIKIWLDSCNKENRPASVTIGLYKNGKLYDTIKLSADNNWRYRWNDLPADAHWHIKEMNVPDEYKVYYTIGGNKIAIVNTYIPETPDEPDKPDNPPDEPTTEEPDEPTTEQPDEPTTEQPDEPTTEQPDEPTTEQPDEPTTEQPDEPTTEQPDEPTTEQPETPDKPVDKIPQTGQLWWPIPVLVIIGMLLFALGWIRRVDGE